MIAYLRSPFAGDMGNVTNVLSNDALFKIQSDVIRDLAARESCIFVGRCADYILRDHPRRSMSSSRPTTRRASIASAAGRGAPRRRRAR